MEVYVLLTAVVLVVLVLVLWLRGKNLRVSVSVKSGQIPTAPGPGGKPLDLRFEKTIKKESYTLPLEVLDLIKNDRKAEAIAMMAKAGRDQSECASLYDEMRKALKSRGTGKPLDLRFEKTIKKESYSLPLEVLDLIKNDSRSEAIAMISKQTGRGESESASLYDGIRQALKDQGKL